MTYLLTDRINNQIGSRQMRSLQKSSQASLQSEQEQSNNTFQSNSQECTRSLFSFQETQCQFCLNKYIICEQLKVLRETIIAKNEKIRQLETFIQKLSKMAFTESRETQPINERGKKQRQQSSSSDDMTFAQMHFDQPLGCSNSNKMIQNPSHQSLLSRQKSSSSSILSQLTLTEKQRIKREIKSQLNRMNLSRTEQQASPSFQKESSLRSKLMQIMNILPSSDSSPLLQSFRTQSQPFQQGRAASIKENSRPKNRPTKIDSRQESLKNTIKSQASHQSNDNFIHA